MPTNVKAMPPSLIGREMNELTTRAEARGHFLPAELKRFEDLHKESIAKEELKSAAKEAEMRKIGVSMRREANQKRLDSRNVHEKIISRVNQPGQTTRDREDAIRRRRASK